MQSKHLKPVIAVVALLTLVGLSVALPVGEWLFLAVERIEQAGPAGAVAYALLYALATVTMVPGTLLTLAAGFLYGPVVGFFVVLVGANLGATAAFLLGRTLMRERVEGWVAGRPRFEALDKAMGGEGLRLVTLIRLSPVFPFSLINYGLGLTRLTLRDYVLGSVVGMAPAILLFVYFGSTLRALEEVFSGTSDIGASGQVLFAVGLVATIAVTVFVGRAANRALNDTLDKAPIA